MAKKIQNKEELISLIYNNKSALQDLGVKSIGLFGSFVKNQQNEKSDIDLLIEFHSQKKNFRNFMALSFFLEELCGRKVEIVTSSSISPYFKPHIMNELEDVPIIS